MSDTGPTLLFKARVEADGTAGDRAYIEPDLESDQTLADEISIGRGRATPVEVHRAGTAALMGEKDALLRESANLLRDNLKAIRELQAELLERIGDS